MVDLGGVNTERLRTNCPYVLPKKIFAQVVQQRFGLRYGLTQAEVDAIVRICAIAPYMGQATHDLSKLVNRWKVVHEPAGMYGHNDWAPRTKPPSPKLIFSEAGKETYDFTHIHGPYAMWWIVDRAVELSLTGPTTSVTITAIGAGHLGPLGPYLIEPFVKERFGDNVVTANGWCLAATGKQVIPMLGSTFGKKPCLGTSPFGYVYPIGYGEHCLVDTSTASSTLGYLAAAKRSGQSLTKGVWLTPEGERTTDPAKAQHPVVDGKAGLFFSLLLELDAIRNGASSGAWRGEPTAFESGENPGSTFGVTFRNLTRLEAISGRRIRAKTSMRRFREQVEHVFGGFRLPGKDKVNEAIYCQQTGFQNKWIPVAETSLSQLIEISNEDNGIDVRDHIEDIGQSLDRYTQ